MRLLTLKQTAIRATDTVFKNSGLGSLIVAVITWSIALAAFYLAVAGRIGRFNPPRFVSMFVGLFMLLFAWLSTNQFRAARRATNWLLRIRGNEVLVKFRSFSNWKLGEADVQVIELQRGEIASVRKHVQRIVTASGGNSVQAENNVQLDLALKGVDMPAIQKALDAEIAHPGWGGNYSRTKIREYPVQIVDGNVLRIAWKNRSSVICPGIDRALAELSRIAPLTEETKSAADFTASGLKNLSEAEQREQLINLALRDPIAAHTAVRRLHNCSLSEARQKIEEWTEDATKPA